MLLQLFALSEIPLSDRVVQPASPQFRTIGCNIYTTGTVRMPLELSTKWEENGKSLQFTSNTVIHNKFPQRTEFSKYSKNYSNVITYLSRSCCISVYVIMIIISLLQDDFIQNTINNNLLLKLQRNWIIQLQIHAIKIQTAQLQCSFSILQ